MSRNLTIMVAATLALAAEGGVVAPASAQATVDQEEAGRLEEVVVTARKRDERLKDVPLSISAFSEDFIDKTGLDSVPALATQTPGLSFRPAFGRVGNGQGGGSSNRPTMRGQANITGLPNMGFFVDGVFVSGNITSYQLDNVERVEVIRGPQAALFGRSTFAGAVNFITRKPGDEVTGKVTGTVGADEHYEVSGYVSGPIIEGTLRGEINGRWYDFGGQWLNRATGETDGGEESSRNVGAKLYWTPSESFDLEFNFGYAKDRDGHFVARYSGTNCLGPNIVATTPLPRSSNRRRGYFCGEPEIGDSFWARYDIIRSVGLYGIDRETWRSSAKANYTVNEWTVTGIAAANRFRNQQAFESGFEMGEATLRPNGLNASEDRRKDWSLELRVDSPVDAKVHGLLGAYLYREDDGEGFSGTWNVPATIPIPIGSNLVTLTRVPTKNDSAVRNWSVFGLVEFAATDRLKLTAEGRYQTDKIISDPAVTNPSNVLLEETYSKFLPRGTALYLLNDDWNLYANVARGNKPGGFNPVPADADAASQQFILDNYLTFGEESAWTYEFGIKGANAERTVSLNASLYWIDWTNQQLTQTYIYTRTNGTNNTSSAITNAGKTRIRGLEIDVTARPIDALELRLAYAYVDSEILDFVDPETEDIYDTDGRVGSFDLAGDPNGQVAGAQVPQSPRHQVILSGDFTQPVSESLSAFLRADLAYEAKRYDQVHELAHTGDSYNLNLRTGLNGKQWSATLFVDNVLDDDAPASLTRLINPTRVLQVPSRANPAVLQTTFYRDIMISYPRKRTYGLTMSYRF